MCSWPIPGLLPFDELPQDSILATRLAFPLAFVGGHQRAERQGFQSAVSYSHALGFLPETDSVVALIYYIGSTQEF